MDPKKQNRANKQSYSAIEGISDYKPEDDEVYVAVITPEEMLFEGKVFGVSSFNNQGVFDIWPQHTNFISIIHQNVVITHKDGQKKEFPVQSGVIRAIDNKVEVFLGIKVVHIPTIQTLSRENLPKDTNQKEVEKINTTPPKQTAKTGL